MNRCKRNAVLQFLTQTGFHPQSRSGQTSPKAGRRPPQTTLAHRHPRPVPRRQGSPRRPPLQTPNQIAANFRPASRTRVAEILQTLTALGQTRQIEDHYLL